MMEHLLSAFPGKENTCVSTHSQVVFLISDPGNQPISISSVQDNPSDDLPHGITVMNPNKLTIEVLAIDKCLIQDHEPKFKGVGRCEGVMGNNNAICWFEIKKRKNRNEARREAYQQIEDTIRQFQDLPAEWRQFALVALLRRKIAPARSASNGDKKLFFSDTYRVTLLEGTQISFPL